MMMILESFKSKLQIVYSDKIICNFQAREMTQHAEIVFI